jgi:hypothetical protein
MTYTQEAPLVITGVTKVAVTNTSQVVVLSGESAMLKNLGSGTVYISNSIATTDAFPLVTGDTIGPLTGTVNMISDSTADVRILYFDPLGI